MIRVMASVRVRTVYHSGLMANGPRVLKVKVKWAILPKRA